MSATIKVLIIDEHAALRRKVGRILSADPDFDVIGEAAAGREALEKLKSSRPDLVLLDLGANSRDGLAALAHIKQYGLARRCIILADSDAAGDVLKALRNGADGYLLKGAIAEDFCARLKKVMSGVTVLQESLLDKLVTAALHQKPAGSEKKVALTERETQILRCLTLGFHNKRIADALGISLSTVKVHTKNLLVKLKLTNQLETALWAHKTRQAGSLLAQ